jgi:hypothetical protein
MLVFRLSALVFAFWAVVFAGFPTFVNEFAGVGYTTSKHAEDWTRLVGLLCIGYAVLLCRASASPSVELRRSVAIAVSCSTLPCAILMAYWQLGPDRRWTRLDLVNIALLLAMSIALPLSSRRSG